MKSINTVEHIAFNSELFNIQVASKMTGLNPHTIRAWEKRYQAVTPDRDSKGRRTYKKEELARLAILNQLVFSGHNISSIANLSELELQETYQKLFQRSFSFDEYQEESIATPFNTQNCLQNLTFALITQSLNIVNHELDKARQDLTGYSFVQNIIDPLLNEAQELLSGQRIDHFQYEAITHLVATHLKTKVAQVQTVSDQEVKVVILHPQGLLNEIQALKSALTVESEKLSFQIIGNNISAQAAAIIINQLQSQTIIIAADKTEFEKDAMKIYEFLKTLKGQVNSNPELMTMGNTKVLNTDIDSVEKQKSLKELLSGRYFQTENLIA